MTIFSTLKRTISVSCCGLLLASSYSLAQLKEENLPNRLPGVPESRENVRVSNDKFETINGKINDWQIQCRQPKASALLQWRCIASNGLGIHNYRSSSATPLKDFKAPALSSKAKSSNKLFYVQVAAFLTAQQAQRYIKALEREDLTVRRTSKNGRDWYNVTTQVPTNYDGAKTEATDLEKVTGHSTWIRNSSSFN